MRLATSSESARVTPGGLESTAITDAYVGTAQASMTISSSCQTCHTTAPPTTT